MSEKITKITVYRIHLKGHGSYYEEDLDALAEMIKDSDYDSEYSVTKLIVDKEWYDGLPEFDGF